MARATEFAGSPAPRPSLPRIPCQPPRRVRVMDAHPTVRGLAWGGPKWSKVVAPWRTTTVARRCAPGFDEFGLLDIEPELRKTLAFLATNARRDCRRRDATVGRLAAGLEEVMRHA